MTDLNRRLSRRQALKGAAGASAALGLAPLIAACGGSSSTTSSAASAATSAAATPSTSAPAAGGKITIGSFQDNALAPLRDVFFKRFETETGIHVDYVETDYNSWYQKAKTDGLQKTGAYDVYIMDDNWVPEFAAGNIIKNLDEIGFKANPDILAKGLEQGYWPPKSGARLADFKDATPALYAIVIIDDVEILYYNHDYFPTAPKTWDDIYNVAKTKAQPPTLYGWSARGVKGNPIVQTYLPLLTAYGGSFAQDDWRPGFAGPEGVGALARLFEFIPYMPTGVAEFDTDQEVQVLLEGKCTALTEYTGLSHRIDDPASSKVVGKIDCAATPAQEKSGPAIGTFICGVASGAQNTDSAVKFLEWFTSEQVQIDFARDGGSAAVTGKALSDSQAVAKYRWLPAIADAVNNSVPKPRTPDEPKMEDILGTACNEALVEAIQKKTGYTAIAQAHLTKAANDITAFLKQQGGYGI